MNNFFYIIHLPTEYADDYVTILFVYDHGLGDIVGRNFDLSSRLPITLMMMAVAMTFSPALPVLFPMIAVYLVCTYFGDKFHLLRVCRTPPQVSKPSGYPYRSQSRFSKRRKRGI